jgi:hypothetical protein
VRGSRFAGGYGGLIEGVVSGVDTTSRESVVDGGTRGTSEGPGVR